MSAPERFQVGDTVRCVDPWPPKLVEGAEYVVVKVTPNYVYIDNAEGWWLSRFVLVSRPTPPALDPFAWTAETAASASTWRYNVAGFVAWSRFCYWAAQSNLAAHFLPTTPAARTRASNGRDVPVATVLVELPVGVAEWYAEQDWWYAEQDWWIPRMDLVGRACRRALGVS